MPLASAAGILRATGYARLVLPTEASPLTLPDFEDALAHSGFSPLRRADVTTVQVNVGRRCNQACHHCHVDAGPKRTERMDEHTAARVLALLAASPGITTLDVTGGAPELWDGFRGLVAGAAALGRRVLDRCNLTVLLEPGQEDTAAFLAANGAGIVASLPCYGSENVDRQRGSGVFERSLEALRRLNALGYGRPGSALTLHLVYNPLGPALPPDQTNLEARYRDELGRHFGIEFHRLLALTNLPIARFAHALERDGHYAEYLSLLAHHFNPATVPGLMCRSLVSVSYDGTLHDCDFHQMLGIPLGGRPRTIFDLEAAAGLYGDRIATARHCFGCTAGAGSSCGGAIEAA